MNGEKLLDLEELLKQKKKHVLNLDISDKLKFRTISQLDHIKKKRKFKDVDDKAEAIYTIIDVVEKTKSVEALEAAKRIINGSYQLDIPEGWNAILSFASKYESSELIVSISKVLGVSEPFGINSNAKVRLMFDQLICREENNFSLETLLNVNDIFKGCGDLFRRREKSMLISYLALDQLKSMISEYSSVISDVAEDEVLNNDSLDTLLGFYKESLNYENCPEVFKSVRPIFKELEESFYLNAKTNFIKFLDLYKSHPNLITELCVNNFNVIKTENGMTGDDRVIPYLLYNCFKSVILPEVSEILKTDVMADYVFEVTKLIRDVNNVTWDKSLVESLVEMSYDYALKNKDIDQLVEYVDFVVGYTKDKSLSNSQFKHLVNVADQVISLPEKDRASFFTYHHEIYFNLEDHDLRDSLNKVNINSLVTAYQNIIGVTNRWQEEYSEVAKDTFFSKLNANVSKGRDLKEKERILREYSNNVVSLIKDNVADLLYLKQQLSFEQQIGGVGTA